MFEFNTFIHMVGIVLVPLDLDEDLRFNIYNLSWERLYYVQQHYFQILKTHHCILWIQSTFVIYMVLLPVSYDVITYYKGASVLLY